MSYMTADTLIDSNILVYAYDTRDKRKNKIAIDIISKAWTGQRQYCISSQNLIEFYHITTKKVTNPITSEDAMGIVVDMMSFDGWIILFPGMSSLQNAMNLARTYGTSIWDAHIIAVMREHDIKTIITENTKDFKIPGIKAVNPFLD